jgi:hypothetical protein
MKVASITILASNEFSSMIHSWATSVAREVHILNDKSVDFLLSTDSLLIFNQNQELTSDIAELKGRFDHKQMPVHKIDINGTLRVGVTNFDLWLESNKVKHLMVLGSDDLAKNPNLLRFLEAI